MMTEMREYIDSRLESPGEQKNVQNTQYSPLLQANMAWVDSCAEAEAYPIEPGQAIILISKDKSAIYEKVHDKGSWKPPELREYVLKEDEPAFVMPKIPLDTGLDDMRKEIAEIKTMMEGLVNVGNSIKDNADGGATTGAVPKNSRGVKSNKQHIDETATESAGSDRS